MVVLLGEVLEEPPIEPPVVPVLPPLPTEPLELPPMPVLAPPEVPEVLGLGEVVLELEPELLVPCFARQSVRAVPVSRLQSCVVELEPLLEEDGLTVLLEPLGLVVVVVVVSDGLDELPAEDDGLVVVVVDGDGLVVVVVLDEPLMPVLPLELPEPELCAMA